MFAVRIESWRKLGKTSNTDQIWSHLYSIYTIRSFILFTKSISFCEKRGKIRAWYLLFPFSFSQNSRLAVKRKNSVIEKFVHINLYIQRLVEYLAQKDKHLALSVSDLFPFKTVFCVSTL